MRKLESTTINWIMRGLALSDRIISKNWLDFTFSTSSDYDLVIKVCDHAASEIWQLNTCEKSIGTLNSAFGMS